MKTVAGLRKAKPRGLPKIDRAFGFIAAAYDRPRWLPTGRPVAVL